MPDIILSGFADEAAPDKMLDQQFSVMAALGLRYLSVRFLDIGNGVQNVLDLNNEQLASVRKRLDQYGLQVASLGSPVGKVKICDQPDGTSNRFVPFPEYLEGEVATAINAAQRLHTKLIRGFSFYHPRDTDHAPFIDQVVDQLGQIVDRCDSAGLTFGLEVEANLVGHTGEILAEIHRQINHTALTLIFDGGNLVSQGFSRLEILEQFRSMLPGLGWMHVKDYLSSGNEPGRYVDEEALNQFVPADRGSTGHQDIFDELRQHLAGIRQRLKQRQIPGFFVDLEPHLKGGGQFGGFSGPDGMGIALRCLCQVLDQADLAYDLRSFEDLDTIPN